MSPLERGKAILEKARAKTTPAALPKWTRVRIGGYPVTYGEIRDVKTSPLGVQYFVHDFDEGSDYWALAHQVRPSRR